VLDENEDAFRNPPVDNEHLKAHFDHRPTGAGGKLSKPNQRVKWFGYPKRRILATFEQHYETVPDALESVLVGPQQTRQKEIAIILALDENSWIDSTPADRLTDEFQREGWLPEFIDDIYADDRATLRQLFEDSRPGIKFALLEAYDHRIDRLDDAIGAYGRSVGYDKIKGEIEEACDEIRAERTRLEADLEETVSSRISDLEASIADLEAAVETSDSSNDIAGLQRELHDIRVALGSSFLDTQQSIDDLRESMSRSFIDTQQSIETLADETTSSGEFYNELGTLENLTDELDSLILRLRNVLGNERAEVGEALLDIQSQLEGLDADLEDHCSTVEDTVERLYDARFAPNIEDESFQDSRQLIQEMSLAMLLLARLEEATSQLNDDN
jgi:predicted  nucleic acid-binding Zn-ribbon protein